MDYKREIIKKINELSGSVSPYDVFTDWIHCLAISISNACTLIEDDTYKTRERDYQNIIAKYEHGTDDFAEMSGMLVLALEDGPKDILSEIYMDSGMGNKSTGQFFTPASVTKTLAKLVLTGAEEKNIITLYEPSCGAGGMIIAAAALLYEKGINYQQKLDVIAQDLDFKAVYMCYVQLSLLGIRAVVAEGDTLTEPYYPGYPQNRVFLTPMRAGMLI